MRALISLTLAFVMALTSVSFASARVQEAGMTDLVICSMGAAITVTLDATGNPVDRPHHCPDCLAALPMPALPMLVAQPAPKVTVAEGVSAAKHVTPYFAPRSRPARGPPFAA